MPTAKEFKVGYRFDFTTAAPTILNGKYTNMLVKGEILASVAIERDDVVSLYETLKGHIDGLPSSIHNCTFLIFENTDGTEIILAKEYIDPFSIVKTTSQTLTIVVPGVSDLDIASIKKVLAGIGQTNAVYTTVKE